MRAPPCDRARPWRVGVAHSTTLLHSLDGSSRRYTRAMIHRKSPRGFGGLFLVRARALGTACRAGETSVSSARTHVCRQRFACSRWGGPLRPPVPACPRPVVGSGPRRASRRNGRLRSQLRPAPWKPESFEPPGADRAGVPLRCRTSRRGSPSTLLSWVGFYRCRTYCSKDIEPLDACQLLWANRWVNFACKAFEYPSNQGKTVLYA